MIQVCEVLGDIVGFSGSEVRVLKDLWEQIPTEFREDAEQVFESACSWYYSEHNKNKTNGVKVAPSLVKKQAITTIIQPFLDIHGLSNFRLEKRVTRGTGEAPKETKVKVERRTPLVEMAVSNEEVCELFDNFNWDADVFVETPNTPAPEVPALDFGFGDLFEDEEGFDFNNLNF